MCLALLFFWKNGGGSKYFLLINVSKYSFFIFKNLFLTSAHQNDIKT
jgi:hypothetical protein